MLLRHAGRMRWRQRYVYQPRPRRFHGRNRADPVVRIRESPQGRGAQCRADRGAARPTAFEEGIRQLKAPPSPEGLLFHHHMHFVILLVRWFAQQRSEEHTSELQSLMRISYAVFCLKKKNKEQTDVIANEARRRKTIETSKKTV